MNYAVITICLLYMFIWVGSFVYKLSRADRVGRLKLVKGYAQGKFAFIYISAIPLYFIGILAEGANILEGIFIAIKSSVELVVLKLEYGEIATLFESNPYYAASIVILFILCALNIAMVPISIFYQKIANAIYVKKATKQGETSFVVVGANEKNRNILVTSSYRRVWFIDAGDKSAELDEFAYINKIAVVKIKNGLGEALANTYKNFANKTVKVVVNTGDDEKNLLFVEELAEIINKVDINRSSIDDERGLNVYAFGEPENRSAFLHFVKKSSGQIRYVSRHKLTALDFANRHPLTEYMGEREIDYNSATIRKNVDLNVVMVGYNKMMQEILITSIANNQYLSLNSSGETEEKVVDYTVFASEKDESTEKNLNHTYYRYGFLRNDMLKNQKDYLELPPLPANLEFLSESINDISFYSSVRTALTPKEGKDAFNQIIVALGKDMENIDVAEKISAKIKEWGMDAYTKVYVQVSSHDLSTKIVKQEYKEICDIIPFADEQEVVYDAEKIISESIEAMARGRHLDYYICDHVEDGKTEDQIKKEALEKWYGWSQTQRESNIYGVLSIRTKLNLMGYDYDFGKQDESIKNEFLESYQRGDKIEYMDKEAVGKKLIKYDYNFVRGSLRECMARQEHQRWNAYMITQGIVPSSKKEIETEGGKNMALRRHGCLTTYDGLFDYNKIIAKRENRSEKEVDVIHYDYQLMDDVVWLLGRAGQRIIRKK